MAKQIDMVGAGGAETGGAGGTRARNMAARRTRILDEARRIIAADGFDGLSTRALAKAAGVSQPTLYNLIGTKDDILRILLIEGTDRIAEMVLEAQGGTSLELAEAVINRSVDLFGADPDFYRAGIMAGDRLVDTFAVIDANSETAIVGARGVGVVEPIAERMIAAGDLMGRVPAMHIARQLYICFRGLMRDWAFGLISLEEFRTHGLSGFYIILAADAAEELRAEIMHRHTRLFHG